MDIGPLSSYPHLAPVPMEDTTEKPKILIVGAGPVGLILALSLLKNNVPIRIIEKSESFHKGTRGPGVKPRILELEHFLGVREDVEQFAVHATKVRNYDPKDPHRVIKKYEMVEQIPTTPAFPIGAALTIPQYLHEGVLRDHISRLGGKIELGVELVGLEQDEDGVFVDIEETRDGKTTRTNGRYDWVIGTDGGHSIVRKHAQIAFLGETREAEKMYIADCVVEGLEEEDRHTWGVGEKESVVLRCTGQPKSFQLLFMGTEEHLQLLRTKERNAIEQVIQEVTKRTDLLISEVTWQGEWHPNIRMAEHFKSGRVLIAGDAAHTHSPAGGQGLNTGVMDAFNLGWKLALVVKGEASTKLLDSYELERLPVVSEMVKISTGLHNALRDSVGRPVAAEKANREKKEENTQAEVWFRGRRLHQLEVNYRWSPIVLDQRFADTEAAKQSNPYGAEGHEARAGDRAPDAPKLLVVASPVERHGMASVGENTRLFDVFNPGKHTVLVFVSEKNFAETSVILKALDEFKNIVHVVFVFPNQIPSEQILRQQKIVSAGLVLKDTEGHAHDGYGVKDDCSSVVIVRPDGVIGAFVQDENGIAKYFSLMLGK
ncbi:hypothetical protein SCHPADRAFT_849655 [Schizopora paradoxa]|uniref:Uncharacterized protein n=1 Tax=Schizopora paradoxa TaxID=27342 RepID=A0A0H2RUB0_9AGAM|nr:hypothetical protein SCHPADRAFT_849655 [Schizopora paradoxa]